MAVAYSMATSIPCAELVEDTRRMAADAALAGVPVAGRSIDQHLLQSVCLEQFRDHRRVMRVGNQHSTPPNPARAAAAKRSRNGCSVNSIDRLAAKPGMAPAV
jgi:hypothetical protein